MSNFNYKTENLIVENTKLQLSNESLKNINDQYKLLKI